MRISWSPSSWTTYRYAQHVDYPSDFELAKTLRLLNEMPPLVTVGEITQLKGLLKEASLGERFLLQGGDCAESFAACHSQSIEDKVNLIAQMSLILSSGLNKPVIKVGRIAGQFAKPRSALTETINGQTLPSYRGDLINETEFSLKAREPNPLRMLDGYHHSAITLNFIRGLLSEENHYFNNRLIEDLQQFSGLQQPSHQKLNQEIVSALCLLKTLSRDSDTLAKKIDFFTSHEAMHLPYETALTRFADGQWFNQSTHYPWVGYRTAAIDSAHIEYLRGIANPVAIKLGPNATEEYIISLINKLNPTNEMGKLTLITRFGANKIATLLPRFIKAIQANNKHVLWICDPMHGNTRVAANGYKTRDYDDISKELHSAIDIHKASGSILGGAHLELTGEGVTECLGGFDAIKESDLPLNYQTLVDPRLNKQQAIEIAFSLALKAKQATTKYPKLSISA